MRFALVTTTAKAETLLVSFSLLYFTLTATSAVFGSEEKSNI